MSGESEGWWSDEIERFIDARKVACRKLQGARKWRRRRCTEATLGQLNKIEKGGKGKVRKEKKKLGENSEED